MADLHHISWKPMFTVNNEKLDAQHQKLFSIINELTDIQRSGSEECYEIIEDLVDYLSVHFHAEQMVMMKSNYPEFSKHMQEHERFIKKVDEFLQKYRNKEKNLTLQMIAFLSEWIYSHTTTFDLDYGKHLLKSQKTK